MNKPAVIGFMAFQADGSSISVAFDLKHNPILASQPSLSNDFNLSKDVPSGFVFGSMARNAGGAVPSVSASLSNATLTLTFDSIPPADIYTLNGWFVF